MPIIKSAQKRMRVEARRTKRNQVAKNRYKELIKEYTKLIEDGKTAEAEKLFPQVQKSIDMAAKKNLLHKRNAARKKSNLAKMLAAKPAKKAVAPKKTAPKASAKDKKEEKAEK